MGLWLTSLPARLHSVVVQVKVRCVQTAARWSAILRFDYAHFARPHLFDTDWAVAELRRAFPAHLTLAADIRVFEAFDAHGGVGWRAVAASGHGRTRVRGAHHDRRAARRAVLLVSAHLRVGRAALRRKVARDAALRGPVPTEPRSEVEALKHKIETLERRLKASRLPRSAAAGDRASRTRARTETEAKGEAGERVKAWLRDEVGLAGYVPLFVEEDLDDLRLVRDVDIERLQRIGVKKLGHRICIMQEIAK